MAQILWRPIIDELDRRMFVFHSEVIPGWTPIDGWHGVDIDDPDSVYSLETAKRGDEIRGLAQRYTRFRDTTLITMPAEISAEAMAEAADHLNFGRFVAKPVEDSPTKAIWIIRSTQ